MAEDNVRSYIVGHRGAGNSAPGSTMSALSKAAELGLGWVEFDVRLTADNHLVIANADDLFECSGQAIKISETCLDDLLKVDVGHSYQKTNDIHRIPLFEDAVKFCIDHNIRTQIELKAEVGKERVLALAIIDCLNSDDLAFSAGREPLITSFSSECLMAVNDYSEKSLDTGLLIHTHLANDWEEVANTVDPKYVHFYGGAIDDGVRLTDKFGQSVQDAGYLLNAYKVNSQQDAKAAINAGAQRFTSDEPELLLGLER
ncbi:MAG: hypothetical protein COA45_00055 [Zetaproteobacteria bacterium]|nr:MAG: hypothetical protein COA45_00055 [Zetaproteobacteria bacterium]